MMDNNTPTGTNAPKGELDKASSPATYTITAIAANRPRVVNNFVGLFINHILYLDV